VQPKYQNKSQQRTNNDKHAPADYQTKPQYRKCRGFNTQGACLRSGKMPSDAHLRQKVALKMLLTWRGTAEKLPAGGQFGPGFGDCPAA
jgi:hypothetical protein